MFTVNKALILVAVILFVLAGLGVSVIPNPIAWGLALWASSNLV